ncbi:MAG TPA: hypothetical protein VGB18_04825 [Candidatus Thermoplasmatota archaeon]
MRFAGIGSVVLASLMILVPAAAAETIGSGTIDFKSPSEVMMILDGKLDGDDALQARELMDADSDFTSGNGDGTVQQEEVDAFENFFKGFFSDAEDSDVSPTGSFTVDGKPAEGFALISLDVRDATGPVDSEDPITMHIEFKSTFPVTAGDRHEVRILAEEGQEEEEEGNEEFGNIGTLTLKAPKGYIIDSATGLPAGAKVSSDKRSISYDGLPQSTGEDTVIVFTKSGGMAPGPAFLIGLIAMVAIVAFRRR